MSKVVAGVLITVGGYAASAFLCLVCLVVALGLAGKGMGPRLTASMLGGGIAMVLSFVGGAFAVSWGMVKVGVDARARVVLIIVYIVGAIVTLPGLGFISLVAFNR